MRCVAGIDLGSTTTKAVLLDEDGKVVGRGITNSRSNYMVACAVALEEAHISARFQLLRRALDQVRQGSAAAPPVEALHAAFRLELYLDDLEALRHTIEGHLESGAHHRQHGYSPLADEIVREVLREMKEAAPPLFAPGASRRSDFFRDLAGEAFMTSAEKRCLARKQRIEPVLAAFDRAILKVETDPRPRDFTDLLRRSAARVTASGAPPAWQADVVRAAGEPLEEVAFTGTGYGRQTLPFPKEVVRSEILCHGRGAHHVFAGTRTVLDIGGQDTKAIQVDERGLVSSFQMNDRCAAGCGRYLGYIADELNLGLHELGPLALNARRAVKVNSTCTVFAGAELRERLSLGERREDILAGLHRSIMLRAMSLLARSGGVKDQFTFTGGVGKNPAATKVLRELVTEHYGAHIQINLDPDSIYMGALGAALFGLDDLRAGRAQLLPSFAERDNVRGVAAAREEAVPCHA